jgi:hypothetical protein
MWKAPTRTPEYLRRAFGERGSVVSRFPSREKLRTTPYIRPHREGVKVPQAGEVLHTISQAISPNKAVDRGLQIVPPPAAEALPCAWPNAREGTEGAEPGSLSRSLVVLSTAETVRTH